jgi:hypothetical protein
MSLYFINFHLDDFKSLLKNFDLIQIGKEFGNFGLGNGKS